MNQSLGPSSQMMTGAQHQAQLMMDPNQMAQMIQQQQQIINQQSRDLIFLQNG